MSVDRKYNLGGVKLYLKFEAARDLVMILEHILKCDCLSKLFVFLEGSEFHIVSDPFFHVEKVKEDLIGRPHLIDFSANVNKYVKVIFDQMVS